MKVHGCHCVRGYLVFVLVFSALSGCALSYKTPDYPISEMAVIIAANDELGIVSVDELRTCLPGNGGRRSVAMLPGEHVIVVQHRRNGYIAEGSLTVDVQAGRRYVLKSASRGYHVVFWIEELSMETGRFSRGLPRGCLRPILYVNA